MKKTRMSEISRDALFDFTGCIAVRSIVIVDFILRVILHGEFIVTLQPCTVIVMWVRRVDHWF